MDRELLQNLYQCVIPVLAVGFWISIIVTVKAAKVSVGSWRSIWTSMACFATMYAIIYTILIWDDGGIWTDYIRFVGLGSVPVVWIYIPIKFVKTVKDSQQTANTVIEEIKRKSLP